MQHIAIMKKSWGLLPKILTKEKKIESRWYNNRYSPWNKIKKGDVIYFKDSGEPVTIKAEIDKVIQCENLTSAKVRQILKEYGQKDGLGINDIPKFYKRFKNKKYCILVFLKNPKPIKPFNISKTGFGMMSAWLCVDNVNRIKL